ncbi:Transposase [Oopsacas minuta]|uniref:Transposase n=1 Tax=Oopsacas minuta TaxID=111878 RepID=A0AAV7KG43_9METZ|nr:Transposase [Oopsacas minuta]
MGSGRPADAVNPENIQKVKRIIKNEHRIIIDEMMSQLDISRGSLHTILHEHLLVRKVAAQQNTVTASWYVNICMPQVIEKWSILHPKAYLTSLQWNHHNASAHKAALTMDFFAENGIKLIPHPAYSPDLAPCDFFLFPKLKKKNKGVHFNSTEEARLTYNEALHT